MSLGYLLYLPSDGLGSDVLNDSYRLSATFDNIGDIHIGSRITLAGIEIGRVSKIEFEAHAKRPTLQLRIGKRFGQIPVDTTAAIQTQGILGGRFVALVPGRAAYYLTDNGTISQTQSAFVLEKTLRRLVQQSAAAR